MHYQKKRDHLILPIIEWANANKHAGNHAAAFPEHNNKSLLAAPAPPAPFKVPPEFNGKDYITMLLHIDAEIEHGLMLQYLYSAYSMGNPSLSDKLTETVAVWKKIILGIAKEEMGHFISVQNVLKVIGAPLNFGRESYPWDTPFYPFPFTLEKFSLKSLAKYVYAEAPAAWLDSDDPIAKEVKASVDASVTDPHTVGALFKILLQLIQDPQVIPDEDFQAATYQYQAKFDEWGRGYTGGDRGTDGAGVFSKSPDVLVAPLLSRDDAYAALSEIAEQGEGEMVSTTAASHFERFLFIYKEYRAILYETGGDFKPSRNVATNPYVSPKGSTDDTFEVSEAAIETEADPITRPETILWCNLLDLRYRLLLNFLHHSFALDNGLNNSGNFTPRGMVINSTFGEMYNLRSLSAIIVQQPLCEGGTQMAGPPFTTPYSFDLPAGEHNRWKAHRDILIASHGITEALKQLEHQPNIQYLNGLQESDRKLLQTIEHICR